MERSRIPNRLKHYRRLAGYSQKEAAQLLGVKNSCICRWEKGKGLPSLPSIFKLSLLYRTHPIHLYQELWHDLKKELPTHDANLAAHPEPITH